MYTCYTASLLHIILFMQSSDYKRTISFIGINLMKNRLISCTVHQSRHGQVVQSVPETHAKSLHSSRKVVLTDAHFAQMLMQHLRRKDKLPDRNTDSGKSSGTGKLLI